MDFRSDRGSTSSLGHARDGLSGHGSDMGRSASGPRKFVFIIVAIEALNGDQRASSVRDCARAPRGRLDLAPIPALPGAIRGISALADHALKAPLLGRTKQRQAVFKGFR